MKTLNFSGFGVLPAGSIVGMSIFGVHMNPKFYSDPLRFNPDHFSIENRSKRPAFAYIPFSAGPRNCIGNNYLFSINSFLLLYNKIYINVLRSKIDKKERTIDEISLIYSLTLKHKTNGSIRLKWDDTGKGQ